MRFWLIVLIFLGASGAAAWRLNAFNQFSSLEPVALARCAPVRGIAGPEDIEVDEAGARAFISSLDRREKGARGAVHVFDVDDPLSAAGFRDRTGGLPQAFRPYGLDYYDDGETRRLFVVNEAAKAVELYDVAENGDLIHLETFREQRLTSPNNVAAVGPRQFYVTNDVRPGRNAIIGNLHFLMGLSSGEIFYMDGDAWRVAAEDLRFANGLALSPDGLKLYVAETSGNALKLFDRNPETGALALAETIPLGASPDNINMDASGAIWVGALPKPLAVPRLARDADATAPSEVLRVDPEGGAHTVYRNDGAEQSAATVAARVRNKLLIGALYEEKFLFCELPPAAR
ncbi:SMP-30/gluconolactonase/LRE family protein [Hyphococcus sp.]|jgi:arylesterase/paraoxonase|uniref:SMP-30/gluconolactonase/LRE family protein n=1 Tax=Hyphococcus sp. TaxID=2038636 RepID=UPI003D0C5A04